jgi:hypothetical protein
MWNKNRCRVVDVPCGTIMILERCRVVDVPCGTIKKSPGD